MVMVTDIDNDGRIRLSRAAVLEGWSLKKLASVTADPVGGWH